MHWNILMIAVSPVDIATFYHILGIMSQLWLVQASSAKNSGWSKPAMLNIGVGPNQQCWILGLVQTSNAEYRDYCHFGSYHPTMFMFYRNFWCPQNQRMMQYSVFISSIVGSASIWNWIGQIRLSNPFLAFSSSISPCRRFLLQHFWIFTERLRSFSPSLRLRSVRELVSPSGADWKSGAMELWSWDVMSDCCNTTMPSRELPEMQSCWIT